MEFRAFLILLLVELMVFFALTLYCRGRLKLYCLDFHEGEFVQWVTARNLDEAIQVYCETVGEACFEEEKGYYFEYCPDDTLEDFYDHCISVEPENKVFPHYEEDGTLIESKTVKEWIKEAGRPCYVGASEC